MRCFLICCVFAITTTACGGGGTGDDTPTPDAPPANVCTGALYDTCLDTAGGSDCLSGICRPYVMLGANACTQVCSATVTCPNDPTGAAVRCNNEGQCRPDNLNLCTPP
jgi:hypothetical protein